MTGPSHLDTTGTLCPVPLLLTARQARRLPPGARLEVVGDDPAMAQDLRSWCEETGHRLLELDQGPDGWVRVLLEIAGLETGLSTRR